MQAAGAYTDGWTPLMAAAVAGHEDLALRLLRAAGSSASYLARSACGMAQAATMHQHATLKAIGLNGQNRGLQPVQSCDWCELFIPLYLLHGRGPAETVRCRNSMSHMGCSSSSHDAVAEWALRLRRQKGKGGMTATHVAARRGCLVLLRALLHAGGPQVALAEDGMRRQARWRHVSWLLFSACTVRGCTSVIAHVRSAAACWAQMTAALCAGRPSMLQRRMDSGRLRGCCPRQLPWCSADGLGCSMLGSAASSTVVACGSAAYQPQHPCVGLAAAQVGAQALLRCIRAL